MAKEGNKYVIIEYSPSYPDGAICTDAYQLNLQTIEEAEQEVAIYCDIAENFGYLEDVSYEICPIDEVPDGVV